nr:MAG TPA: hypothetical protein [Caudoviricetes sp.]
MIGEVIYPGFRRGFFVRFYLIFFLLCIFVK